MSGTHTARQFWIEVPGKGEIRQVLLSPSGDGQILVRTRYSAVSRGTETLVFRGEVPPSQYEAMRAPFQEGEFPAPVKYGYISVGEVVEGQESLLGRNVFALHPHQDLYRVPAGSVTLLPDGVPVERAVLAANMETAVNAMWDALPGVGDRVVVVGAGVLGLLTAWLCRQVPGTEVTVIDINPERETVARELGVAFLGEPPAAADADLVVHASGRPAGLRSALAAAGVEGKIIDVSWYGSQDVALPLGEVFHSRRLTIKSSQVGRLPPERTPRWSYRRRMELALRLLGDAKLDALITGESDFEDLPEVLEQLSANPGDALCHRIRYPTS